MPSTKAKPKRRNKPRIKSKNKSYSLKDSGLYNLTTKKRLEDRLKKPIHELLSLANNSNYRVFLHGKEGKKKRQIQAPNLGLDVIQTRIASLLVRIAMPDYVHSGVKGRSNVTNAKIHIGFHPVLTMDIKNFYPSISKKSIYHFFHSTMKAAPDVAGILAELCSYNDHVPTGSRVSMPLSFWANESMYGELQSLCCSVGAVMSVYVDDLTFSGPLVNKLFERNVRRIVNNAGLTIHPDKTRLYRSDEPKLITGVIVRDDRIEVKNKHHKAIYTLFNERKAAKSDKELKALYRELLGRLNAAGQIDPAFKQRARMLASIA